MKSDDPTNVETEEAKNNAISQLGNHSLVNLIHQK